MKLDTQYAIERTMELLDVDSPTGYTRDVGQTLMERLLGKGFTPVRTRKAAWFGPLGRAGASPHACRACGHAGPDGAADQAGWAAGLYHTGRSLPAGGGNRKRDGYYPGGASATPAWWN